MSSERFDELGLPRRSFLKKAAAAALTAPAIVSFALDAVAEGAPRSTISNQCIPNQVIPNQLLEPGQPLYEILQLLIDGLYQSTHGHLTPPLQIGDARTLSAYAFQTALLEARGEYEEAFKLWSFFIAQVKALKHRLPKELAEQLIYLGEYARELLGCP